MALFVDPLINHGWVLRGRAGANGHLFTGRLALVELHALAEQIGMRRACLPAHALVPHCDLTPSRWLDTSSAPSKSILTRLWRSGTTGASPRSAPPSRRNAALSRSRPDNRWRRRGPTSPRHALLALALARSSLFHPNPCTEVARPLRSCPTYSCTTPSACGPTRRQTRRRVGARSARPRQ